MPAWTYYYVALFTPLAILLWLAAWRWGGRTESSAAAAIVGATIAQKIGQGLFAPMYSDFEPVVATIDIAMLIWLAVLAQRDRKAWILCAAALQLLCCFAHVAKAFQPDMPALIYAILMGSAGYPLLFLLALGIATHKRKKSA